MSLSATALGDKLIELMESKMEEAATTDYMAEISSVIESYLLNNWEGKVSWAAANPSGATDPVTSTTAYPTSVKLGWSKSVILNMTDPSLIKKSLNDSFSFNILTTTMSGIKASDDDEEVDLPEDVFLFTVSLSTFDFGDVSLFDPKGSNYKDHMKYLASSIVSAVTGVCETPIPIPEGSHLAFISSGSTITELV